MKTARLIALDQTGTPDGVLRMFADRVDARALAASKKRESVVTVTRTGTFHDPRYGEFEITREMLLSMQRNFTRGVVGQEIFVDKTHDHGEGAAGTIRELMVENGKLRARVEWTDFGLELIEKKGFIYLSAEFHENWQDNEKRQQHGPTLLGAALTTRPVIKHLDPIQLSEKTLWDCPTYLTPRFQKLLSEEHDAMLKELLERLRRELSTAKLHEDLIKQLTTAFEKAGEKLDDQPTLEAMLDEFVKTGKTLAEKTKDVKDPGEITLSINMPEPKKDGDGEKTLSVEDVKKILADREAETEKQAKQLAEQKDANVKAFSDAIDKADGLSELDEKTLAELKDCSDLITADMSTEQVTKLAERQIAWGNKLLAQQKLAAKGFEGRGPAGDVRVLTAEEDKHVLALQEQVDKRMGFADMSDAERYERTGGSLPERNKKLAEAVLKTFDAANGRRLSEEYKKLDGGEGNISDVDVPGFFERTVIREALYQLTVTQFMDTGTAPFTESISIPFSSRDATAAGKDDIRVYEGQPIKRAGVKQQTELAYPIPQKLAFQVSDELRRLTAASIYDWDAVAENIRNAGRIVGEDTERLGYNEILLSNHRYGAIDVTDEDIAGQMDGADRVFVLANFPVVRPSAVYDMQGNQIGNTRNPVTVTYEASAIDEFDGTGDQDAGTYYVLDYDLGEIYLVDEAGDIQTPANDDTCTVSYSYATNVFAFDTDLGSATAEDHWDTFMFRYGLRKTEIQDKRFHMANYGLMSETLMNQIEQGKRFAANFRRPGTDLSSDGSLGRIKAVPNFNTTAPGLHIGDRYAIIGERNITRFRLAKPWQMYELENQRDENGRFTGEKEAYGDQWIFLHTPSPLRRATTAMLAYSASAREARVNP